MILVPTSWIRSWLGSRFGGGVSFYVSRPYLNVYTFWACYFARIGSFCITKSLNRSSILSSLTIVIFSQHAWILGGKKSVFFIVNLWCLLLINFSFSLWRGMASNLLSQRIIRNTSSNLAQHLDFVLFKFLGASIQFLSRGSLRTKGFCKLFRYWEYFFIEINKEAFNLYPQLRLSTLIQSLSLCNILFKHREVFYLLLIDVFDFVKQLYCRHISFIWIWILRHFLNNNKIFELIWIFKIKIYQESFFLQFLFRLWLFIMMGL